MNPPIDNAQYACMIVYTMTTQDPTPPTFEELCAAAEAAETTAGMLEIQAEQLDKPRQAAFTAKRNAGTLDAYHKADVEADATHAAFIAVYLPYLEARKYAINARCRADRARNPQPATE